MNALSNRLEVEFDDVRDMLLIYHPDRQQFQAPLVTIRRETLEKMSFKEASEFIGESLILFSPALRDIFKDYLSSASKAWSEYPTMNILSNRLEVEFDDARDMLLIYHPDRQQFQRPLVTIRRETLEKISFKEAAEFIGERFFLFLPALQEIFKDYLWTEGVQPPKKY